MGIRNRTPIGTLREQRKRAESVPQVEATKAKTLASRARSLSLTTEEDPIVQIEKSENLIERLRTVLRSENTKIDENVSDYQVLQDELSRISQHHQQSRAQDIKDLIDLDAPRRHIETHVAPFRYIVINGGKMSEDFPVIPKLDRAPSSLEMYASELPQNPAPRLMPLTLLISEEAAPAVSPVQHDPSHEAAQLTLSSVTYQSPSKKGSTLPKNLVLSLLNDK